MCLVKSGRGRLGQVAILFQTARAFYFSAILTTMDLMQALEVGTVGTYGKPERVITTVISKLFICGDTVLKVYKHEPFFFADLTDFNSRKEFIFEDFFWNNTTAPEVYRHLWGVKRQNGTSSLVPPTMGEDFIIEMSRIDDTQSLTKLLIDNTLTPAQVKQFIDVLVDTLAVLTRERRERLGHLFKKGLLQIMTEDVESMHLWLYDAQPYVTKKEADDIAGILRRAVAQEAYFASATELGAAIDNNSDNLLLVDGHASFIDIMPPMVIWRVVDEYATIARTIVDIEVLGNHNLSAAARTAYAHYGRTLPPVAALVHEIRGACIPWSYRHNLNQNETAEKFGSYAKEKVQELKNLL